MCDDPSDVVRKFLVLGDRGLESGIRLGAAMRRGNRCVGRYLEGIFRTLLDVSCNRMRDRNVVGVVELNDERRFDLQLRATNMSDTRRRPGGFPLVASHGV